MLSSSLLFISVLTLFCYIIVGYILRKTNMVDSGFAKYASLYSIYVAQVAMLLHGFLVEFKKQVLFGIAWVFVLSMAVHFLFYLIVLQLFKNAPDKIRCVLRYGLMFSNAGYMGIPVISDILGPDYVIYATVYIVSFNIFAFSLGRLIYTGDRKYISLKAIFINPAVVPIIIGFIIFITGIGGWIHSQTLLSEKNITAEGITIIYNVITTLKNTVAPASMMIVGCRLSEINFTGVFKDKYLYPFLVLRHFVLPFTVWAMVKVIILTGVLSGETAHIVMAVMLVLSSTPSATTTTIFAELYGGDSGYAGKLVAISTLLSVITMPTVAMLLKI